MNIGRWKYLIIIGVILGILGVSVGLFWIFNEDRFSFESETIIFENDNYNMRISYPKFNDWKFKKKLERMIKQKQKVFLEEVRDSLKVGDTTKPLEYDLNINYSFVEKDAILSIHFKIFQYVGGAHYEREDLIYYYDKEEDKEVPFDDLILDTDAFYAILRKECKEYLLLNKETLQIYDEEELLDEGLRNIDYVAFGKNAIEVIFPPYQVGPWSSGEIVVEILYEKVKEYLNSDFFETADFESKDSFTETLENGSSSSKKVQAMVRDVSDFQDKKLVALTFDDGPSWNKTEKLLDGLKERNAKVSFFMLGSRIQGQEELVKRIYEEGHTIGSHSYEHKNFHNTPLEEAMSDITKTNEMLEAIIGFKPKYLRPPYGNYSKELLDASLMSFILWNVDTLDWKKKDSKKIADFIIETANDGDIILLHDLYDTSIEGAFLAIDTLSKEGFAFVSIDELIRIKGVQAELGKAYRYFR